MWTMSSPLTIVSAVASGFAIGLVPTLVDSVRAPVAQQLKASDRQIDRILALFYLAWLPAMPLSGWLLDHWLSKEILFFGLLGCVLGTAWLGLSQSRWSLATSVLILGVGYSWLATGGIRLMADALRFTEHSSPVGALSVGFVFVGLGAVAGPWLVANVERRWGHRQGLLYLSLGLVAAASVVFAVPRDQFPTLTERLPWGDVIVNPRLWLLGIVILLYFALENCLDVWPEPYLKEIGYRGTGLTVTLLIFWLAFTAARAVMGWLPASGWETWLLLGLVLAASFTMGNLAGANEYSSGTFGFWMTGAFYGPLLPAFLALVMMVFPQLPATALGMMLALSGLDTLIVRPPMIGLARRRPARTVMRVPMILALLMAAPLLVLALIQ
jgi:MFS family permease